MTLRILLVLIVVLNSHPAVSGQERPAPTSSSNASGPSDQPESTEQAGALSNEQKEQKKQLEIGMILVGGILILGVFLLVLTLLTSRRFKRTIAQGRQPSQPRDELWYLKNPPDRTSPENNEGLE